METSLIDGWLGENEATPILDDASVSTVRERARSIAQAQTLTRDDGERLATIASELAHNQLAHGRHGQIVVRAIRRADQPGVEIIAADSGEGILDPGGALSCIPRPTGSLGIGLAAVREHADELDVDVRVGEGTCVRARLFAGKPPRWREIGIFGRPYRDEVESGDHAVVRREQDRLVVMLCDGLGHGASARAASTAAVDAFEHAEGATPRAIVEACHAALVGTRGAVLSALAIHESGSPTTLDLSSVGNITVELVGGSASRRFAASSFVVGSRQLGWRAHDEQVTVERREVLLVYSDGIQSRGTVADDHELLRKHPVVIAQQLVERYAREDDDVLVLVAK